MSIIHADALSLRLKAVKTEMTDTEPFSQPSEGEGDAWYQVIQDPTGKVSWRRADLVDEYGELQRKLRGY